jgi:hypothetical protein
MEGEVGNMATLRDSKDWVSAGYKQQGTNSRIRTAGYKTSPHHTRPSALGETSWF